jgi:hypothetical protein
MITVLFIPIGSRRQFPPVLPVVPDSPWPFVRFLG